VGVKVELWRKGFVEKMSYEPGVKERRGNVDFTVFSPGGTPPRNRAGASNAPTLWRRGWALDSCGGAGLAPGVSR